MQLRYPKISIRSKREFARHIARKDLTVEHAQNLINDVFKNKDKYWKDNVKESKPQKGKFVRTAKNRPLGKLLGIINKVVLEPYDGMLPPFIFGGVKGKNHIDANIYLLGKKRERTLLGLDIQNFFEQIHHDRIFKLFCDKFQCGKKGGKIFADLCCVPVGEKGSTGNSVLARGFATSSRLAVWTNLDLFLKLHHLVNKRLSGHDPRIAIYVDDIGITASRVTREQIELLRAEVMVLFETHDPHQPLKIHPPANPKKSKIINHRDSIEHLGLVHHRNKLSLGKKITSKLAIHTLKERQTTDKELKKYHKNAKIALKRYKYYVSSKSLKSKANS